MKVISDDGYQKEIDDNLMELLYSTDYMTKDALILSIRVMNHLSILAFEDENGLFVSISSIKKRIKKSKNDR